MNLSLHAIDNYLNTQYIISKSCIIIKLEVLSFMRGMSNEEMLKTVGESTVSYGTPTLHLRMRISQRQLSNASCTRSLRHSLSVIFMDVNLYTF